MTEGEVRIVKSFPSLVYHATQSDGSFFYFDILNDKIYI